MSPNPVKVDEHTRHQAFEPDPPGTTMMFGSTEFTKEKVVGVKQRNGIFNVLLDVIQKGLSSVASRRCASG